ncbi:MAG: hypothetical protein DHS20C16_05650 [Phycisphaerae bacterium]|nr:MAG: hypothetical protein DHS20C16_05650 [Phycisphaerae bacterium]
MLQYQESLSVVQVMLVGRPDGVRPGGRDTSLQFLSSRFEADSETPNGNPISPQEWMELDREFTQFQQRRKAAALGAVDANSQGDVESASVLYRTASEDAQHCLAIIAFARRRHPSQQLSAARQELIPSLTAQKWIAQSNRRFVMGSQQDALETIRRGIDEVAALLRQNGETDPDSNASIRDMKIVERAVGQPSGTGTQPGNNIAVPT